MPQITGNAANASCSSPDADSRTQFRRSAANVACQLGGSLSLTEQQNKLSIKAKNDAVTTMPDVAAGIPADNTALTHERKDTDAVLTGSSVPPSA